MQGAQDIIEKLSLDQAEVELLPKGARRLDSAPKGAGRDSLVNPILNTFLSFCPNTYAYQEIR